MSYNLKKKSKMRKNYQKPQKISEKGRIFSIV